MLVEQQLGSIHQGFAFVALGQADIHAGLCCVQGALRYMAIRPQPFGFSILAATFAERRISLRELRLGSAQIQPRQVAVQVEQRLVGPNLGAAVDPHTGNQPCNLGRDLGDTTRDGTAHQGDLVGQIAAHNLGHADRGSVGRTGRESCTQYRQRQCNAAERAGAHCVGPFAGEVCDEPEHGQRSRILLHAAHASGKPRPPQLMAPLGADKSDR